MTAASPAETEYVVPRVGGDAGAAFRLAQTYHELADAVAAAQRRVAAVAADLTATWRGPAAGAAHEAFGAVLRDAIAVARGLDEAAAAYETYARQLEKAHEQHHFSVGHLLKIGAVVAASASAIVVTVGVAGAVEAAGAAAAVSGAAEAAGSALLADSVAAGGLEAALEGLPTLRPLLAFVVPHLLQTEWAVGATAVWDEATQGRLRWRALGDTAAVAFTASGTASVADAMVAGPRWVSRMVDSGVWAGATAVDDELVDRRLQLSDVGETFVLSGAGGLGRDALAAKGWWPRPPDYHRLALVALVHRDGRILDIDVAHEMALLRQPAKELALGRVDLRLQEGPGHTISRHVGRPTAELLGRARVGDLPQVSTYWDEVGARSAIAQTLRAHREEISVWAGAGSPGTLRLRLHAGHDLGFAVDPQGRVTFLRRALVVLRRDAGGVVLVTSYPVR